MEKGPNITEFSEQISKALGAAVKEMEKDGYDLFEQVLVLILGGILGGQSFQIAQASYPLVLEVFLQALTILIGVVILGAIHFVISLAKVVE